MMTVGDGKTVEIYCAYARKQRDEELWEKLKTHLIPLEIKGDITLWYDGKVSPGSEWKPEIDTHLDTAEVILLLISPDFLASERHYEQMKRAIKRYKAREVQVIPIILYPCVLEDSPIEGLPVLPDDDCPITEWGSGEDKAFVNISKGIRRIVHELIIRKAEVASNQHLWHVPARDSHFTDREDILNNLHNAFKADPNYRNTPIRTVQALTGLAGIGKTEIAIEYAHRYREDYRHIFWMQAGTRKELIADFLKLARFLHLRGSNLLDSTSIIAAVKDWLETEKQWLLIWDGVSDFAQISDMLPLYSTGHIILTTCTQASEPNTGRVRIGRVRVDKMRPEDGALFFLRRASVIPMDASFESAPPEYRDPAKEFAEAVGGHPLALDWAARYIADYDYNPARYLYLYRNRPRELLLERRKVNFPSGWREIAARRHPSVASIFNLQFQKIKQANRAAADMLYLFAFLSPDDIPEEIISQGGLGLGRNLQALANHPDRLDTNSEAEIKRNEAIKVLLTYSLVHRNRGNTLLTIHPLVQTILKDEMKEKMKYIWADRAVRAVNHIFPQHITADTWPLCERYLHQAKACADLIYQYHLEFAEAGLLLYHTASYLHQRAQYHQAEQFYRQALDIYTEIFGPHHHNTMIVLSDLIQLLNDEGQNLSYQGQYEAAKAIYLEALALTEKKLGKEHSFTGAISTNLARIYYIQHQYEQAEPLYLRALDIAEKQLGEHLFTTLLLSNLGLVYQAQGKYQEVGRLYQKALVLARGIPEQNQPYLLDIDKNLKYLQQVLHQYEQTTSSGQPVSPAPKQVSETSPMGDVSSSPISSNQEQGAIQTGPIYYEYRSNSNEKTSGIQNTTGAFHSEQITLPEQMEAFEEEE